MVLGTLIINIKIIKIDLYLFHPQKSIEGELRDINIKGKALKLLEVKNSFMTLKEGRILNDPQKVLARRRDWSLDYLKIKDINSSRHL